MGSAPDNFNPEVYSWINRPSRFSIEGDTLTVITDQGTDFWQRTYYGFQNDNGHAFVKEIHGDFTYCVRTDFKTEFLYDQCGIIIYLDSDFWVKASVEHENEEYSRLGTVVTSHGYSDWASADIPAGINCVWYRLSRRGKDFLVEYSVDGSDFHQMRMFHLHKDSDPVRTGVYACSPGKSSFKAVFSRVTTGPCLWGKHMEK